MSKHVLNTRLLVAAEQSCERVKPKSASEPLIVEG